MAGMRTGIIQAWSRVELWMHMLCESVGQLFSLGPYLMRRSVRATPKASAKFSMLSMLMFRSPRSTEPT